MCVKSLLHVLYFYVYIHIMYIYKGSWELFCNDWRGRVLKVEPGPGPCYASVWSHTWPEKESMSQKENTQFVTQYVRQAEIKAVMMGRTTAWPGQLSSCFLFQPNTHLRTPRMDLGHFIYLLLFLIWPFAFHCHLFVQSAIEEHGWS